MKYNPNDYLKYADPSDTYDTLYIIGLSMCLISQMVFTISHPYILLNQFYLQIFYNILKVVGGDDHTN